MSQIWYHFQIVLGFYLAVVVAAYTRSSCPNGTIKRHTLNHTNTETDRHNWIQNNDVIFTSSFSFVSWLPVTYHFISYGNQNSISTQCSAQKPNYSPHVDCNVLTTSESATIFTFVSVEHTVQCRHVFLMIECLYHFYHQVNWVTHLWRWSPKLYTFA